MSQTGKERLEEFTNGPIDLDPNALGQLVISAGGFLELLVGKEVANEAMLSLFRHLSVWDPADEADWHKSWSELGPDDFESLEAHSDLMLLYAYAFYGLPLVDGSTAEERRDAVSGLISHYNEFLEQCPPNWADLSVVERTITAASIRQAIDGLSPDDDVIHPEGLAALARVSVKSIRNLLAPSSRSGIRLNANGHISIADARRWLSERPDFRPTMWDFDVMRMSDEPSPEASPMLSDVLFVPVAKDGSWFSPECRRSGKYQIGPKGAEETHDDYRAALERLSVMRKPSWRRPNANSNWGIVTAASWIRKTASELGL